MSVVTSGHDVADARLHREVAALLRQGLTVEVLGLGEASTGPSGCSVRTSPRGGLLTRAMHAAITPWRARGRVLLTLDPDIAVTAWAMTRLRRRHRLVVDVHEDYAALLTDRGWAHGPVGAVARAVVGVAGRAASRAELTVVADQHVPPLAARNRLVLRNLPDPELFPPPQPPRERPTAVYVGDLRGSRGLWTMVEAVALAPRWELDLIGPVAPAEAERLRRRLAEPDLAGRVRCHGRQPPARAWQLAAGAWVGLALLQDTPAFHAAVPSKLYEYLAFGLPVLVSDLPRMAAIVHAGPVGAVVAPGDHVGAAAALEAWLDDPAGLSVVREAVGHAAGRARAADEYTAFGEAVSGVVGCCAGQPRAEGARQLP